MLTPLSPAAPRPPADAGSDPLRAAARDLHEQFLAQMLRASGLGEALKGEAGGEAAALADLSFGEIAREMAEAQPQLTERLYASLRRAAS